MGAIESMPPGAHSMIESIIARDRPGLARSMKSAGLRRGSALAALGAAALLCACADLRGTEQDLRTLKDRAAQLPAEVEAVQAATKSANEAITAAAGAAESAKQTANQSLAAAAAAVACCQATNEWISRMFARSAPAPAGRPRGWGGTRPDHRCPEGGNCIGSKSESAASAASPATLDDSLAAVDRILQGMPLANIAFNVPEKLNLDDVGHVQLLLALGTPVEALESLITAEGAKSHATIHVADRMEARLTGANFAITQVTDETQGISSTAPTQWLWDIKPQETGKQTLHLTLSALLMVDGSSTPRVITTFDRYIEVNVHWYSRVTGFVGEHLEWVWATLFVPAALWLFRLWKRHRAQGRPRGPPASPGPA